MLWLEKGFMNVIKKKKSSVNYEWTINGEISSLTDLIRH